MPEENKDQNQNQADQAAKEVAEATGQADQAAEQVTDATEQQAQEAVQPEKEKDSITKFEMPSFFAMLITLGLYTCSAVLIMALAQI